MEKKKLKLSLKKEVISKLQSSTIVGGETNTCWDPLNSVNYCNSEVNCDTGGCESAGCGGYDSGGCTCNGAPVFGSICDWM